MGKSSLQFNGLNGQTVNREQLAILASSALAENNIEVYSRVMRVLSSDSSKRFKVEIDSPADLILEQKFTYGLETIEHHQMAGLGKVSKGSGSVYAKLTDAIIKRMAKASSSDYKRAWGNSKNKPVANTAGYHVAFNFETKKAYAGINQLLLGGMFEALSNPYYLTAKQVEHYKGEIKKGAKSHEVVFFTFVYILKIKNVSDDTIEVKSFTDVEAFRAEMAELKKSKTPFKQGRSPRIRFYQVYNGTDIEGINFGLENLKVGVDQTYPGKNKIAETIIENYKSPKLNSIRFGGDRAFYQPGTDSLQVPDISDFDSPRDFYRTMFHELSHSTGSSKRLKRDFSGSFGSKKYAFEELVAELGAVFVSAHAGISWYENKNHAGYLKSWNNSLTHIQNDSQFIFKAAALAQHAAEWILNPNSKGVPAYMTKLGINKFFVPVDQDKKVEIKAKGTKVKPKAEPKKATPKKAVSKKKGQNSQEKTSDQLSLFGVKKKVGLKSPVVNFDIEVIPELVEMIPVNVQASKPMAAVEPKRSIDPPVQKSIPISNANENSLASRLKRNANREFETFAINDPDILGFLGKIERKERESVVVTITGGQGSGKTRFVFQLMQAFAQNYNVGHASMEEHPDSKLYFDKVEQYLDDKAIHRIAAPEINSISDLDSLIQSSDVIFIDSFTKIQEMQRGFEVDKDLRKKYDGKLFFVIFQQTEQGKMRGGSKSQFDGDVILFTEKFDEDYRKNYVYPNKHRYSDVPADKLKFSIYNGKLIKEQPEHAPQTLQSAYFIEEVS